MIVKLTTVDSWRLDDHLLKAGYATVPGGAEPNNDVAEGSATLLTAAIKLK